MHDATAAIPGWDPADPLVVKAIWSAVRRRGRWTPMPFIEAFPKGSNIELNFLEAPTDEPTIQVEVRPGMGGLLIVVPDSWGVNTDRLTAGWGSIRSHAAAAARPGSPLIAVSGSMGLGTFRSRGPNRFDRKRLAR